MMPPGNKNYILFFTFCLGLLNLVGSYTPGPSSSTALFAQDATAQEQKAASELKALIDSSPLLKEPETPEEHIRAVVLMIDLARPQLAKLYLDRLVDSKPDEATLLKLRDKHGPALFLRLANINNLKPTSEKLLKLVNEAFRKQGADSKRIDQLIDKLGSSPLEHHAAVTALQSAGAIVVPRMLQRYSSVPEGKDRENIIQTLAEIGKPAIPPLVAAVNSPNQGMQTAAIDALGWIRSRRGVPALWYPAFITNGDAGVQSSARNALKRILDADEAAVQQVTSSGVANELKRLALEHYQRKFNWKTGVEIDQDTVTLWTWDAKLKAITAEQVTAETASKYTGAIYARQAFELLPNNLDLQALYIGMLLDLESRPGKLEQEFPTGPATAFNAALAGGSKVVSKILIQALESRRIDVAIVALQVLSQISSRHQLYRKQSDQSPIISALNYPDARVQFAAAVTVLQLDPQEKFRGSRRVVHILARTLMNDGSPAAIVVHPDPQQSTNIATFLQQKGYESRAVSTGRSAFELAATRDDIELIMVDANVARWGLSQTIANFRADSRTAYLPIVIFGPEQLKLKMDHLIRSYPLLGYVEKPTSYEQLELQIKPILSSFKTPTPTPEQRNARVESAAYWLAHIATSKQAGLFDISVAETAVIKRLNDPELFELCMQILNQIPTASVQKMFQQIVINTDQEVAARETAALNLAFHIQRFGLLLERDEVASLEAIWKASQDDPKVLTALATVIGSLKPDSPRVGVRLKRIIPPVHSLNR